jgi:hypothetical protein
MPLMVEADFYKVSVQTPRTVCLLRSAPSPPFLFTRDKLYFRKRYNPARQSLKTASAYSAPVGRMPWNVKNGDLVEEDESEDAEEE